MRSYFLLLAVVGFAACHNQQTETTTVQQMDTVKKDTVSAAKDTVAEPPTDSCEQWAEALMQSSDAYKTVVKENPDWTPRWLIPDREDSGYVFGLYDEFEDHTVNKAWLFVSAVTGRVYQNNIVADSLVPSAFDISLLQKKPQACR